MKASRLVILACGLLVVAIVMIAEKGLSDENDGPSVSVETPVEFTSAKVSRRDTDRDARGGNARDILNELDLMLRRYDVAWETNTLSRYNQLVDDYFQANGDTSLMLDWFNNFQHAEPHPDDPDHVARVELVLRTIAKRDGRAAADWVDQNIGENSKPISLTYAVRDVAMSWITRDPQQALRWLEPHLESLGDAHMRVIMAGIKELGSTEFDAIGTWYMDKIQAGYDLEKSLHYFAIHWARKYPPSTADWVATLPSHMRRDMYTLVLKAWPKGGKDDLHEWVRANGHLKADLDEARVDAIMKDHLNYKTLIGNGSRRGTEPESIR